MPRYFIEVAYKGTNYSGFQIQDNANTIQAEVEKALQIYYKERIELTGSSRTDAGVHALQNYFHFDTTFEISEDTYHLNAILPIDIVIKSIKQVQDNAHCRFDAKSREYQYHVQHSKNPFNNQYAYYFPYSLNVQAMQEAAQLILANTDFTSFSKKNTQVHTHNCMIYESAWTELNSEMIYTVKANRFLRGMVRGLVGTMLQVGRSKISISQFQQIILSKDFRQVDFSAPPQGLFLVNVNY
ncbi:MAG: tRNA pseudouridine(38-40) synthase TruA [Chitinophagaceae bacterium]|nr:tRNA pseudouridine(38-40) synthase TruA [Chitinophagaceae bacterium]